MILTVTPNLALDVTYAVDRLEPGDVHRVSSVHTRAGGKGVNVARVLCQLGHETRALGFVGGPDREAIEQDLAVAGLGHDLVAIQQRTRRTLAVTTSEDSTLFNEPGPEVSAPEFHALLAAFERELAQADLVVCAGSLPPGVPDDCYARLVERASAWNLPSIVDSSGVALRAALAEGPSVVKPNAAELHDLTGLADPLEGAYALLNEGAEACVVSLGAEGMRALTPDESWSAVPSTKLYGNATGAGDAAVAAIAAGIRAGSSWPELLADAVALSGAAVLAPFAGGFDAEHYATRRDRVHVEPMGVNRWR